jgi:hypothetical protein
MTTQLTPNAQPELPDKIEAPNNGDELDAGIVRLGLQKLLDAVHKLDDDRLFDFHTYGRGVDGVLDLTDPLVDYRLDRDREYEAVRFLTSGCRLNTNGFRLKARRAFLAVGVSSAFISAAPITADEQLAFTTPGVFTYTVPAGVTTLTFSAGGGNGGSGATFSGLHPSSRSRGGRGGGGAVSKFQMSVTPGDVLTFVVGDGGDGGASVPLGPYSAPGGSGPGGGKGGRATKIYRNGTLMIGLAGGGGGGAGSGYTVVTTTPSATSTDPTYGFTGGAGGRGRLSTTTSSSTHDGSAGDGPASYPGGAGGTDPNDTATSGGSGGGTGFGEGMDGTATDPNWPAEYGRGGSKFGERVSQGGSGGENGFDGAVSRAGGGGQAGAWLPGANYISSGGGGGGGVGFVGSVTVVSSGNRGTGNLGGNWSAPNGGKGEPGYVQILNLPGSVANEPGSVAAGQAGGVSADPVPSLGTTSRYYGGRGGNGGGEGTSSPGAPGGVAKATGPGVRIKGPAIPISNSAGLGGCRGAGASGGNGGAGGNQQHVAIRTIEMTSPGSVLTISANGEAGSAGVAGTSDGGGGGGGGGPVSFAFHDFYAAATSGCMLEIYSQGGAGGAGGSGVGSSAMGGAGGQGGDPGPLWIKCTLTGAEYLAYDATSCVQNVSDFASKIGTYTTTANVVTPGAGSAGLSATPWTGGAGGASGRHRLLIGNPGVSE